MSIGQQYKLISGFSNKHNKKKGFEYESLVLCFSEISSCTVNIAFRFLRRWNSQKYKNVIKQRV